jgi:hypothetical protein
MGVFFIFLIKLWIIYCLFWSLGLIGVKFDRKIYFYCCLGVICFIFAEIWL